MSTLFKSESYTGSARDGSVTVGNPPGSRCQSVLRSGSSGATHATRPAGRRRASDGRKGSAFDLKAGKGPSSSVSHGWKLA